MKSTRSLELCLFTIVVFNILDAVFTLDSVQSGRATEANPLLSELVNTPVSFLAIKLGLVSLGILLLWIHRSHRLAIAAILVSLAAYSGIVVYHLVHMLMPG